MTEKGMEVTVHSITVITLILIILRITKVITISWWWVTFPVWGSLLWLVILAFIHFLIIRNDEKDDDL